MRADEISWSAEEKVNGKTRQDIWGFQTPVIICTRYPLFLRCLEDKYMYKIINGTLEFKCILVTWERNISLLLSSLDCFHSNLFVKKTP